MTSGSYQTLIKDGLWHNNPALVQLLGLCPLLAVSNTLINGLGLGLATLITLVFSNGLVSLCRHHIADVIRLPVFVLIIATIVTIIELIMHAWFYQLYLILGIFIPLIVTNCAIIARAEAYASRQPFFPSILDGAMMGLGFTVVLVILGAMREIIGQGTLFSHADLLFGSTAKEMVLTIIEDHQGVLIALLPPGAFIGLGLMIAVKNYLDARHASALKVNQASVAKEVA